MLVGCFKKEFFTYSQSFPLPTYDYFYINIFIFLRKKRKETLTNLPLVIPQVYPLFFSILRIKNLLFSTGYVSFAM